MKIADWKIREAKRCSKDFFWFAEKYCITQNVESRRKEKLPKWGYLREYIEDLEKGNVIENKARQLIFSTYTMAYLLWLTMYAKSGHLALLITLSDLYYNGTYSSLFGRIEFMHNNLPLFLKQSIDFKKKPAIIYNRRNGNTILNSTTTVKSGHGVTPNITVIDEAGYLGAYLDEIMGGVIPNSERVAILSTPNGKNKFYDICQSAKKGENGFKYREDNWTKRPDHNLEWYKRRTKALTPEQIGREYLCSFEASQGGRIFSLNNSLLKDIDLDNFAGWQLTGGADFGWSDDTVFISAFYDDRKKRIHIFDCLDVNKMLPEVIIEKLKRKYETIFEGGNGRKMIADYRCYGDPSGSSTQISSGKSIKEDYNRLGMLRLTNAPRLLIKNRIKEIQRWINGGNLTISSKAVDVYNTLLQAHYPRNRQGIITSYEKWADPGNFNVHIMDAVGYLLSSINNPVADIPPIQVLEDNVFHASGGIR